MGRYTSWGHAATCDISHVLIFFLVDWAMPTPPPKYTHGVCNYITYVGLFIFSNMSDA